MATLLAILILCTFVSPLDGQELEIIHINVGQGDATLILGPMDPSGDRIRVLVDAGDIPLFGDPDGGAIVGNALRSRSIEDLDFVIVSHYDSDHLGGLVAGASNSHGTSLLLGLDGVPGGPGDDDGDGETDWIGDEPMFEPDPEEFGTGDDLRVGTFIDRGDQGAGSTDAIEKYFGLAEAHGNRQSLTNQNDVDTFEIDLGGGATLTALAANGFVRDRGARVPFVNTENERSLAFMLRFGGFDYLIGGDLIGRESGSENAQVEAAVGDFLQAEGVQVDVLHVNHHGADNASATEFLEAIRPEVAIVSLGNDNEHGHPHENALRRLVEAEVRLIVQTEWGSTEEAIPLEVRRRQAIFQGDVSLRTDGEIFTVSTARVFSADQDP